MKKKIFWIATVVLICPVLYFWGRIAVNEFSRVKYEAAEYQQGAVDLLFFANFTEEYIAYYNKGNFLFYNQEYAAAVEKYQEALEIGVPEERVCMARVNLALAAVYEITTEDEMEKATLLGKLKTAREYLYEDDCAHEKDDSGSSEDAEELEAAIRELEEAVEEAEGEVDDSGGEDSEDEEEQNENDEVEEELENRRKEALESRNEEMEMYENLGDDYYYGGKTW